MAPSTQKSTDANDGRQMYQLMDSTLCFGRIDKAQWSEIQELVVLHPEYSMWRNDMDGQTAFHLLCLQSAKFLQKVNIRNNRKDGKGDDINEIYTLKAEMLKVAELIIDASHKCPPVMVPHDDDDDDDSENNDSSLVKNCKWHTSVLTIGNRCGNTPLHHLLSWCISTITYDLVKLILDSASDSRKSSAAVTDRHRRAPTTYRLLTAKSAHGVTPLHFVADQADASAVMQLLIKACQISHPPSASSYDDYHNKSRERTIHNDRLPMGQDLLLHPLLVHDNDGDTPLHYACSLKANVSTLRLFLRHAPFAALVANNNGALPIHHLIAYNDLDRKCMYEVVNAHRWPSSGRYREWAHIVHFVLRNQWPKIELLLQAAYHGFIFWKREEEDMFDYHPNNNNNDKRNNHNHQQRSVEQVTTVWRPVHAAAGVHSFPAVILQVACLIDPTHTADEHGMLPLHIAAATSSSSISATVARDGKIAHWKGNSSCSSQDGKYNNDDKEQFRISFLLSKYPHAASVLTPQGRLSFHLAIENGQCMEALNQLLEVEPRAIAARDMVTRLYPFMMAGVGDCYDSVDVVFNLLLKNPELVRVQKRIS